MTWLLLGGAVLFVFLGGLRLFEKAEVKTIKSLLGWLAAIAGLAMALLLVLTGRIGAAIGTLVMLGPLLFQEYERYKSKSSGGGFRWSAPPPPRRDGPMSRAEAYEVLGLKPGASEDEIRAAHRRLMRSAHPDQGGSDCLATRINLARDTLLG